MISRFQTFLSTATCATTPRPPPQRHWRRSSHAKPRQGGAASPRVFAFDPAIAFKRLKPKCEETLSNCAFNCNLRHYTKDANAAREKAEAAADVAAEARRATEAKAQDDVATARTELKAGEPYRICYLT